jgi:hypothetical protein
MSQGKGDAGKRVGQREGSTERPVPRCFKQKTLQDTAKYEFLQDWLPENDPQKNIQATFRPRA